MLSRRNFLVSVAALPVACSTTAYSCALPPHSDLPVSARKLIEAAENQIGVTVTYDSAYTKISYPNGDVPRNIGVCTDVVIRAYRDALNVDLQRLVHEDMAAHFSAYPKNWGLAGTDRNIDHRRVPNLMTFFKRQGAALPKGTEMLPGDLVTQAVSGHLPHIVIVAGQRVPRGERHKVIHNIGGGTQFADTLTVYPVTGHYRFRMA
ncbi:MAG: DUF1287 domain-containing protein [Parvibaculum sp.]|nr:DUF1287 domain-containing protein [Parvibaculum sp.]